MNDDHRGETLELQGQLQAHLDEIEEHKSTSMTLQNEHGVYINRIKEEHVQALAEMRDTHESNLAKMKVQNEVLEQQNNDSSSKDDEITRLNTIIQEYI
jgi:hypothetical protein